jgi:ankyrin
MAVVKRQMSAVTCLIDEGADVNSRYSTWGCCPVHYAASVVDTSIIDVLLKNGANINSQDAMGCTPLHYSACGNDKTRQELVIRMAFAGAQLKLEQRTLDPRYLVMAEFLVANGAAVDVRAFDGNTPLHVAARWGYISLIELLVRSGADVNAASAGGDTPLHRLALIGARDSAKFLLEHGANPNAKTKRGYTPRQAAESQQEQCTAALLAAYEKNMA